MRPFGYPHASLALSPCALQLIDPVSLRVGNPPEHARVLDFLKQEAKMASQVRLPRAAKIGLLLSLVILAYVAGKFSELSGNAEWWIGKVCSIASNATMTR